MRLPYIPESTHSLFMHPAPFDPQLVLWLEERSFYLDQWLPYIFAGVGVNGDCRTLYDMIDIECSELGYSSEQAGQILDAINSVGVALDSYTLNNPALHILRTADVIEVQIQPFTGDWLVFYDLDESRLEIAQHYPHIAGQLSHVSV